MKFPTRERTDKVMQAVSHFFIKEGISDFPINPRAIIKANKWGLMKYTELAEENNMTIDEVCRHCQSKDAYIMYDGDNYTIAYNDTMTPPGRIRFTLMHEVGHIYLNHLPDFEETLMYRSNLSKSKYKILENEAHSFARNTLAPPEVITHLKGFNKDTINIGEIMRHFYISQKAAQTRLDLLIPDLVNRSLYASTQPDHFKDYIRNTIHAKFCNKCSGYFVHESAAFCPICGHKKLSKSRGSIVMIYSGHILNDRGLPKACPKCDNEQLIKGEYCKICGLHLINKCTNVHYDRDGDVEWQCKTLVNGDRADGNARHCVECGHETTYLINQLLTHWGDELERMPISEEDLPNFLKKRTDL